MDKYNKEVLDTLLIDIKSRSSNLEFPTFSSIDELIYGLRRKRLYIIGGRPGAFKTSFLLNLTLKYVLDKKKVLYLSLEMAKESILERTISIYNGINSKDLAINSLDENDYKKIEEYFTIIKNTEFWLYDNIGKSLLEVRAVVKQHSPDICIVDFIQMIGIDLYKYEERLIIQEYTREMVRIAKESNIVMMVASQINRAPMERKDKRPCLSDLKSSGSLEENSDCVLALHYPYHYSSKAKKGELEVMVLKNRYGDLGTSLLGVIPEKSIIYSI